MPLLAQVTEPLMPLTGEALHLVVKQVTTI